MLFFRQLINWYEVHKRNLLLRYPKKLYLLCIFKIIIMQAIENQHIIYCDDFFYRLSNIWFLLNVEVVEVLKKSTSLAYYIREKNINKFAKKENHLNNNFLINYKFKDSLHCY